MDITLVYILKIYNIPYIKCYTIKFNDSNSCFEYKIKNFSSEDLYKLKIFKDDLKKNKKCDIIFNYENINIKYEDDSNYMTFGNNGFNYKFKLNYKIIKIFENIIEHFEKN